jgi:nickel transport protein
MKKKRYVLILICLMPLLVLNLLSHGLTVKWEKRAPGIHLSAFYSQNNPMISAKVEIYFGDSETVFQTGSTDKNGAFSFIPDQAGIWWVVVDDEMGHRRKLKINLKEDFFKARDPKDEKPESKQLPYYLKILLGALLILVITIFLFTWIKKKEQQKTS